MLGTAYAGIFTYSGLSGEGGTELGRVEIVKESFLNVSKIPRTRVSQFRGRRRRSVSSSLRGCFRRLTSRLEPRHACGATIPTNSEWWLEGLPCISVPGPKASALRGQLESRYASADACVAKQTSHLSQLGLGESEW